MAAALAKGFIQGNAIASSQHILASCPASDSHLLDGFRALGCQTLHDNKELVDNSDIVVLYYITSELSVKDESKLP